VSEQTDWLDGLDLPDRDDSDDRFAMNADLEEQVRLAEAEVKASRARMAEWALEERERAEAAAEREPKIKPKPKPVTDPAQAQFDAEEAKRRIAEVEQQYGSGSEHSRRAKAEYREAQERAFKASEDKFNAEVRIAAAADVRRRVSDQVRAEQDKMRQEFVRGLDLVKGADPKYFMHSFDRRYGDEWANEQIETRVAAKLKGIETGMVERDTVIDHTKPRPLSPTERVLARQALEDREVAEYANKVLGPDWKKRL
jgi:chromosome segregation ATPase